MCILLYAWISTNWLSVRRILIKLVATACMVTIKVAVLGQTVEIVMLADGDFGVVLQLDWARE